MNRRVSVRAIVLDGNKLLCVKLKQYNELASTMDDHWCLPGGTLEEGEAIIPALEREMIEETGIKPVVGELLYIQQFAEPGKAKEHLEFFFHVLNTREYRAVDLTQTTHGTEEIEAIEFVDPKNTKILPAFLTTEPLAEHAKAHAPAKIFSSVS
jgi:ADP-ribose pyrophosphatase YjhB (NUDIX family)